MGRVQPDFKSLINIKDNSLLLLIAGEYLNEDVFLTKMGNEILDSIEILEKDIINLKKQFPGKFKTEIDTDKTVHKLRKIAFKMLSPNNESKTGSFPGELGRSLKSGINEITDAINRIEVQVKGNDLKYTRTDSIGNFFNKLSIFEKLRNVLSIAVKAVIVIFIIALACFIYLFLTMENDSNLLKQNKESLAFIAKQKADLSEIESRKAEINKKLKLHNDREMARESKIVVLGLEVEKEKLSQEESKIEGEIEVRKSSINKNNEKIEAIRKKTFIQRLLRLSSFDNHILIRSYNV